MKDEAITANLDARDINKIIDFVKETEGNRIVDKDVRTTEPTKCELTAEEIAKQEEATKAWETRQS